VGSVYAYLAQKWKIELSQKNINLGEKIESLDKKTIYKNAEFFSTQIIKELREEIELTERLDVFVKLYVLRRLKEEIVNNEFVDLNDLTNILKKELIIQFKKFDRNKNESEYNPESPSVGMEIQPIPFGRIIPLKIDLPEIKILTKYLRLEPSPDLPFELVLPPTRSPISQLLILRETLDVVGIPTDLIEAQINFGGIGQDKNMVKILQRIMFLGGRLKNRMLDKSTRSWILLDSDKGEVNVREKGSPTADKTIKNITPVDTDHPEMHQLVGEMRAPIEATNFFVLGRGLIAIHKLATIAKAKDRQLSEVKLSKKEESLSMLWEKMTTQLNILLREYDLPNIEEKWSKRIWKKFGKVVNSEKGVNDQIKALLIKTVRESSNNQ
jgi:hypothetical protein